MDFPLIHRSSPANSGPPNDLPQPPPAHKPAPRWLHTLWVVGLLLTLLLLFAPHSNPSTKTLAYSDWKSKISADGVKSAAIDTSGRVKGELSDGSHYE